MQNLEHARDGSPHRRRGPSMIAFAIDAIVYQTPTADQLMAEQVVVAVGEDGIIAAVEPSGSPAAHALLQRADSRVVFDVNQRLLPGLIDLHIHAPQWPQLGTGLDIPLERWLFDYTFPLEARYADSAFATEVWNHMVPTLLAHGTTTAVYYATIDEAATNGLAATCLAHGQRAFVGRVAMDHPQGTPDWYRDPDAVTAVDRSRRSIRAIRALGGHESNALVQPILTPRFIPACTDELLTGMGELAAATGVRLQTHCSESDWEHGAVLDRFGITDAAALAQFGLINDHTVLAHCDHMTNDDLDHVAHAGAAVAHCPLSNAYFGNAVFPVRRALGRGVRVGLGTDIAGGAHPGLLHQAAMAVTASRYLEDGVNPSEPSATRGTPDSRINTVTAFWLATVGGANALGIPAGLLEPGRVFDAFAVTLGQPTSPLREWPFIDDHARIFEKIVRLAGPGDITQVWVNGRTVR
jgi:guanine deaminase